MGDSISVSGKGDYRQATPQSYQTHRLEIIDVRDGSLNKPLKISASGVRIGCSFITNEAVEHIMSKLKERES